MPAPHCHNGSCTGCLICIWTILWGCLEVVKWLKKKINSSKISCKYLYKSIKYIFCDIKDGLTVNFWFFFPKSKNYTIHIYGLQYPWSRKATDKGKIEAMATKFSEKFALSMLKKHRAICRCGLTHLDATLNFEKSFRYLWDTLYIHLRSIASLKWVARTVAQANNYIPKV